MVKFFTNRQAPCYHDTDRKLKNLDLPLGAVVTVPHEDHPEKGYQFVFWTAPNGKPWSGWVNQDHLEPYVETLPNNLVQIDNQTTDTNDLNQYFIHDGKRVLNACGELCVAYELGLSMKEVMENWQVKAPNLWKRVTKGQNWLGTGSQDLITLFGVFAQPAVELSSVLKSYTPNRLKTLADTGSVIASVHIDGQSGRLRGEGVLHWISVIDVRLERRWGIVTVYNPAYNGHEEYSFEEFVKSARSPYGCFAPEVK